MVIANFFNLFRKSKDDKRYNQIIAKKWKPINIIFLVTLLLNLLFVLLPLILKIPQAKNLLRWYLQDIGEAQGDFTAAIATILGTLLAVTGAIWTQSYFESQKEKKLVKVILSQLYTELEDINDRAGECVKLMDEILKKNNVPSDKAETYALKINDHDDLKLALQFNTSAWDTYKSDIIMLFSDRDFIDRMCYLYSIIGMAGNYPYISMNDIYTIAKRSIDLYGDVSMYLEEYKINA